jgi:hypothetical protein
MPPHFRRQAEGVPVKACSRLQRLAATGTNAVTLQKPLLKIERVMAILCQLQQLANTHMAARRIELRHSNIRRQLRCTIRRKLFAWNKLAGPFVARQIPWRNVDV